MTWHVPWVSKFINNKLYCHSNFTLMMMYTSSLNWLTKLSRRKHKVALQIQNQTPINEYTLQKYLPAASLKCFIEKIAKYWFTHVRTNVQCFIIQADIPQYIIHKLHGWYIQTCRLQQLRSWVSCDTMNDRSELKQSVLESVSSDKGGRNADYIIKNTYSILQHPRVWRGRSIDEIVNRFPSHSRLDAKFPHLTYTTSIYPSATFLQNKYVQVLV